MACYYFVIRGTKDTEDLGAMDFADDIEAVAFGKQIIRDLMDRAAKQHANWTMEIREGERAVRSVPFGLKSGSKETKKAGVVLIPKPLP
jgi:hypothetical protein